MPFTLPIIVLSVVQVLYADKICPFVALFIALLSICSCLSYTKMQVVHNSLHILRTIMDLHQSKQYLFEYTIVKSLPGWLVTD